MPEFNFSNDIETDNFYRGLGTSDGSTLFVNKEYRVVGDKMNANNGQNSGICCRQKTMHLSGVTIIC